MDDVQVLVNGISENLGRADMTVMEEAQAYADLVGFEYAPERIGEMFGKSAEYAKWRMGLPNLTTSIARGGRTRTGSSRRRSCRRRRRGSSPRLVGRRRARPTKSSGPTACWRSR
ncbi:hypothetical protein ACFQLX_11815 [Streptomyces polyrhachis]|uniref:Uncharacterized protein n=1 Tax=Streptomyces polyrhachis TaxID=1282885 RepID=A0ABW2GDS3_9ACTN